MGLSYLFITHNIGVVACVADHVAVMRQGRMLELGPAVSLLQHPTHPYTPELLATVPKVAVRR